MARVQVSDEVWAAYRTSLGTTPVGVALGELMSREVGRAARRSASDPDEARLALEDARQLSDELGSLITRLERPPVPGRPETSSRCPTSGAPIGQTTSRGRGRLTLDHGVVPAVRVGRVFRARRADVDALLERASADSSSLATRRARGRDRGPPR
jgi:hypothetical protein